MNTMGCTRRDPWTAAHRALFKLVAVGLLASTPASAQQSGSIVAWGNGAPEPPPGPNTGYVSVKTGWHHMGLKVDGSIVAWGPNDFGECDVPPPNSGFTAIAVGLGHSLALKSDGTVRAWGLNGDGQCNVPPPNSGFVAIAAGGYDNCGDCLDPHGHSLGLKSDGSIIAWGSNTWGQCNVPSPNANFVAIAAGRAHSLAVRADGTIVTWGAGSGLPTPNENFAIAAASGTHNLALRHDGSVVAWGSNYSGESDVPPPNQGFAAIAASNHVFCDIVGGGCVFRGFSLGLRTDGSILAWGSNEFGHRNVPGPNAGFISLDAAAAWAIAVRVCLPDFNSDDALSVQDILSFIAAWFAGDPRADFDRSGGLAVQDIFAFLGAWFAGCP